MIEPKNIPVFILAGGFGTRLSEETVLKPKPMVEIGGVPILLHIMRRYYSFGFNDFVICAGYRAWEIKHFFLNYDFRVNDLAVDHRSSLHSAPQILGKTIGQEKWRVRIIDTGTDAMTGARLARAFDKIIHDTPFDSFAVTYGDGLSDLNLNDELQFHLAHNRIGTVLGVNLTQRFGILEVDSNQQVSRFLEKPEDSGEIINGGFFLFKKQFREFLSHEDYCVLERQPLEKLVLAGQLMTFRHSGFWHAMDTLRDKNHLENLWSSGKAPWLIQSGENFTSLPVRVEASSIEKQGGVTALQ